MIDGNEKFAGFTFASNPKEVVTWYVWVYLPSLTITQEILNLAHHAAQPIIDYFWQQLATEIVNPHNKDGETAMSVYLPMTMNDNDYVNNLKLNH